MRRVLALLVLLVVVVAPPPLLQQLGFYAFDRLNVWAPADFRVVLALLTVVAWAAWLIFVVSLVLEAIRLATGGRIAIKLPGLTLPQAMAGALLSVLLATAAAPAIAGLSTFAAAPPASIHATVSDGVRPDAPQEVARADADAPTASAQVAASTTDAHVVVHVVSWGDDLWSLAERYYGSGSQWRTIVKANPDLLAADPTSDLQPGTALAIINPLDEGARTPVADAQALATQAPQPAASTEGRLEQYTVRPGDTLWHLAEQRLGDGSRYRELQALNADLVHDPDYIEVGWVLTLPAPSSPSADAVDPGQARRPDLGAPRPDAPAEHGTPVAPATPAAPGVQVAPPQTPDAPPMDAPASQPDAPAFDAFAVRVALGGLAALAASGALGVLIARRRERALQREAGRAFGAPDDELRRFETALGLATSPSFESPSATSDEAPALTTPRVDLVDRAMRLLTASWVATGVRTPRLRRLRLRRDALVVEFEASPPAATAPFVVGEGGAFEVAWAALDALAAPEQRVAYPGLVTLGEDASGCLVMVDVLTWGVLVLDAASGDLPAASLSAMILELTCAPWAAEVALRAVTDDPDFARSAALEPVTMYDDVESGVLALERESRDRHALAVLQDADYDTLRRDPDRADAWAPRVFLFEVVPDADQLSRIRAAVGGGLGLAAVLPQDAAAAAARPSGSTLRGHGDSLPRVRLRANTDGGAPWASFAPAGELLAQTLAPEARAAITRLFVGSRSEQTVPAPWWPVDEPDAVAATPEAPDEALRSAVLDDTVLRQLVVPSPVGPAAVGPGEGPAHSGGDRPVVVARFGRAAAMVSAPTTLSTTWAIPVDEVDASAPDADPAAPAAPAGPTAEIDSQGAAGWAANTASNPLPGARTASQARDAEVVTLRPGRAAQAPRLRLFGAVTLEQAAGQRPSRAPRRCLEYCAWLLQNPGATASEMNAALFVSDATRRSNLSRLRGWLGLTPSGEHYLPEAYTGRVTLHPAVASDWSELQALVAGGVNRVPPERLRAALELVGGAPLADAAPGEWAWAGELRSDMVALVRDAALVLARTELLRGDADAARWAIAKGRLVAPDDELLACELMQIDAQDDDLDAVTRTLEFLTRAASRRGVDLRPQTIELAQRLIAGDHRTAQPTG